MDKEELAKQTYENLCKAFELMEFTFSKNEERLTVSCACTGDTLRINVFVRVSPDSYCVTFYSAMPYTVKKEMIGEVSTAVVCVNNNLKFGKFDIDVETGNMDYNFCNYYNHDTPAGADLLRDMLVIALHTVDKYNDKFFNVNSGLLTYKDFINIDKDDILKS